MKKLLVTTYVFATLFLFLAPMQAHAQIRDWSANCIEGGVATLRCLPDVFNNLIQGALMFAGAVAVILTIYGGIRLGMSGGDPKQVQAAQGILKYAIFGLIIVLSSFGIIFLISYLTGAECITTLGFDGCKK